MTSFTFNYKRFGDRVLPIIPVKIKHKDKSLLTDAYIDSGASISTFSTEIAEHLKINYKKGRTIHPLGTAGHIKAHLTQATLEISGLEIKCNVLFSKQLASKFNLLGLQGVFDTFKITFDNKNKKMIFEKY